MGGGDAEGGLAPASGRPGSCPPRAAALGPRGGAGLRGRGSSALRSPRGRLRGSCNCQETAHLESISPSRAGRRNGRVGSGGRRTAEWGGGLPSRVPSAPERGRGPLLLGVLLLQL